MIRRRTVLAGSVCVLALAGPAVAQDSDGAAMPAEPPIVVTAQLRAQDPIEVPITLTTLTGKQLDRIGVKDFEELARFVPGFAVQVQSPSNPGFVMRGITSDAGTAFNEPRVSIFQDGVSISKSRGSYVELFDLERVEIAKGPQTTLYGRSALIGAVNIIQNKADPSQRSAYLRGEYGNLDSIRAEAMVNVPVGEGAAVRFAGRYRRRDGAEPNLLGGAELGSLESAAGRMAVRIEPTERFSFDLIGNYQHDDPTGTPFISLVKRQTDPTTGSVLVPLSSFNGGALGLGTDLEVLPLGLDRDVYGLTALTEFRPSPALTLNGVTAWRRFRSFELLDPDGIPLPLLTASEDARGRQFSQDLRLRWDEGGPLAVSLGGGYFWETGSQQTTTRFDERVLLAQLAGALNGRIPGRPDSDPAPLALLRNPAFGAPLLRAAAAATGVALTSGQANGIAANLKTAHVDTATNFGRTRAWDVFADASIRPLDRFELNAGLRYSHDDKRSAIRGAVVNGRSILGGFLAALGQPPPLRAPLLGALAVPGASAIPQSAAFPLPLFGLAGQPTANNGDVIESFLTDAGVSYRAAARFMPNPDASLYVGYARGRRPEVLSARSPETPGGQARFENLRAETVDSFEGGFKLGLLERRLLLDGALFHYRYENFQSTELQGVVFVTTNSGRARSTGFEGQFRWRQSDNLTVFGSYAYNHSRFSTGVRRGNRFRLSPDHSFSLGTVATAAVGSGVLSFVPTVTYQSRIFFSSDNDLPQLQQRPNALVPDDAQDEVQDGFALVNARLGYAPADRNWRVEGFVQNLLNERYLKDAGNVGDALGLPTSVPGVPRTYGVSLQVSFGD